MSTRDDLARIIRIASDQNNNNSRLIAESSRQADAVLAAGYRLPETAQEVSGRLAEIRARVDAATGEPWEVEDIEGDLSVRAGTALTKWTANEDGSLSGIPPGRWHTTDLIAEWDLETWHRGEVADDDQRRDDAEFFAHARSDVPWLLAEAARRDAAIEAVRALVSEWHEKGGPGSHAEHVYGEQVISIRHIRERVNEVLDAALGDEPARAPSITCMTCGAEIVLGGPVCCPLPLSDETRAALGGEPS